jgi:hypothetical protein
MQNLMRGSPYSWICLSMNESINFKRVERSSGGTDLHRSANESTNSKRYQCGGSLIDEESPLCFWLAQRYS